MIEQQRDEGLPRFTAVHELIRMEFNIERRPMRGVAVLVGVALTA